MSQTILVTGAAGYIGSHASRLLLESGYRVIALDNLSRGWRQALEAISNAGDLIAFEGDIRDAKMLDTIFNDYEINAVMHFAALCDPDESVGEPMSYYDVNTTGTISLLEAMRRAKVSNIIFSSTCAIYGESEELPVRETTPANSPHPYAHSKYLAEEAIRYYSKRHNFSSLIFRYFNVCGASDDALIGDSSKPSKLLIQNSVRGALGLDPFAYTCPQVNTPDGTPIRDYIDVRDLAEAHLAALGYLEKSSGSELINLGTGRGLSVKEIVTQTERTLGAPIEKHQARPRRGDFAQIYADANKAREVLGWKAKRTVEDSIRALAEWYRRHPKGYAY